MKRLVVCLLLVTFTSTTTLYAFLEDLCLPRRSADGKLSWCVAPTCPVAQANPNRACLVQLVDFGTIKPGRSMIHMDSTYFLAQALGYRADVAYWIAAYNEVTDYTQYVPIDQCGVQAANDVSIQNGMTQQTAVNSGRDFITAQFNGFQRTNLQTDGPLDHYIVNYSPNGQGTDVHGAGGVQAIYPLYYPRPGYPLHIDDTYQKTLANLRQWAMIATNDPGVLCTVGLTVTASDGTTQCLTGSTITGQVPVITASQRGIPISVATGNKVLNYIAGTNGGAPTITYYDQLQSYLDDPAKTTGKLWLSSPPVPVPVQVARFGIYLHTMQDSASHSTYCGDDAPSVPGGRDPGTYMYSSGNQIKLAFGQGCAAGPHLAGHVQETGTGDSALPLRVYTAMNITVDELIAFGNNVARQHGWLSNPDLLPPDSIGGRNARGQSADDLKAALVGTIVSGTAYTRGEVYQSGIVSLPLQQPRSLERLHAMNAALARYSATLAAQTRPGATFTPLAVLPGNSADPRDTSVCWQKTM
ncbi:MAG TPA: hypothetical protein VFN10_08115 [Thermoanaerobaculia bacterium]|nr:hypothetical protein [Thermoanaerobaculia bacterium]